MEHRAERLPTHPRKHRLFLVEDHPITREGFAQLLNFESDLQVCGQATTAQEAVLAVQAAQADLVIVDMSLAGASGLDLIKDLGQRHPALPILVLSTHEESLYAERALRAGAKGYVMKSEPTEHIFTAIRHVLRGKIYLSQRMHERLAGKLAADSSADGASEMDILTDRELVVFQLIGQGRSTTQIAAALNLSPSTVATHRAHIQEKLHLETLPELVCRAAQWVQNQSSQP
jgi:DNA-binding NarL/FixJ family response regulator